MKSIVVLVSGRGSNLQAIIQAALPNVRIAAVVSNRADAGGLELARAHGIATVVLNHRDFESREAFDAALSARIDAFAPDLVVLAGFMRILSAGFVEHYLGRMVNIHPSLLPSFPGLHTHKRALEAGVCVHGATVHFVTPELDGGPVIIQAAVAVLPNDDEAALAQRVLEQEHRIFPQAIAWCVGGQVQLREGRVVWTEQAPQPTVALCSPAVSS